MLAVGFYFVGVASIDAQVTQLNAVHTQAQVAALCC